MKKASELQECKIIEYSRECEIVSLAIATKRKEVVAVLDNGSASIRNINTGKIYKEYREGCYSDYNDAFTHEFYITDISINDRLSALAGQEDLYILNNTTKQSILHFSLGEDGLPVDLEFSPTSYQIAVGFNQEKINIYDVIGHKRIITFQTEDVVDICYSLDGNRLVSVGYTGPVNNEVMTLWDVHSKDAIAKIKGTSQEKEDKYSKVAYSPSGKYITVGCTEQNKIKIFDITAGKFYQSIDFTGLNRNGITSLTYCNSEDKNVELLLVGNHLGEINLVNIGNGKYITIYHGLIEESIRYLEDISQKGSYECAFAQDNIFAVLNFNDYRALLLGDSESLPGCEYETSS